MTGDLSKEMAQQVRECSFHMSEGNGVDWLRGAGYPEAAIILALTERAGRETP